MRSAGSSLPSVSDDGALRDRAHRDAALELDAAVGDQLAGADVDVVARAAAHVLAVDAGAVLAEIEQEAGLLRAGRRAPCRAGRFPRRPALLALGQRAGAAPRRASGRRCSVVMPRAQRLLRIERPLRQLHQRLGARDHGRRALHHGDVGAVLPQVGADIVRGIVRADDDACLAGVSLAGLMLAGMVLLAAEALRAGKFAAPPARPTCRSPAPAAWAAASLVSPARSTATVHSLRASS